MTYTPLQSVQTPGKKTTTTFMAPKGVNRRELPQLLNVEFAQRIINYIINAEGGLKKRKGQELTHDASQSVAGLYFEEWTSDIWVIGYSTTVAVYSKSADTITTIKTNFVTSGFDGDRYGDYFLIASPDDKVGLLRKTINYDAQSANFTVGDIVTGGTSGATAVILEDNDGGTTGTLTLGSISGTFQDNETITDPSGGSATSDGVVTHTYEAISGAPYAAGVKIVENRAFAFDLRGNKGGVEYSAVDDGTNPPFANWDTASTAASAGGTVSYRNAGTVNDIVPLTSGQQTVINVFADKGRWGFAIDTIDSGGTLTKIDRTIYYKLGLGAKKAIHTDEGIFFCNSKGLWQMTGVESGNVRFSGNATLISKVLGVEFFENINFDDADFVKDDDQNTLFLTLRNDSSSNNNILCYNTDLGAFSVIKGWNIRRFMVDENGDVYGIGSNELKIWKLFTNNDDDGNDIEHEYVQEMTVGSVETAKMLLEEYFQGVLSDSSDIKVHFDIYDKDGNFTEDKLVLQWNRTNGLTAAAGYGSAEWGATGWGGSVSTSPDLESFDGCGGKISNFQRLIVRITGSDKVPHAINWIKLYTAEKSRIRTRGVSIT